MSQAKRKILYCGAFRFPSGDAAALRVMAIGKSLRLAGYEVEFLSWGTPGNEHVAAKMEEGFAFRTFAELRGTPLSKAERFRGFITRGSQTLEYLSTLDVSDVEAIICYNANSYFLWSLLRFCRKRGLQLIIDCTEWYDASHLPGGRFGPVALDEWLRMRVLGRMISKGIVISEYLQRHFRGLGMETTRLPPMIDLDEPKWRFGEGQDALRPLQARSPLRLVYAGNPGKKDRIGDILAGVYEANSHVRPICLQMVGPSAANIRELLGERSFLVDALGERLSFTGRVPANRVPELVRSCHFSIVARPRARYAAAGFPTKLVESFAAGTPVITTATGDEGKYVRDGVTGYIISDCDPGKVASVLRRAASLESNEWLAMTRAVRETARRDFDYRVYAKMLHRLISEKE